MKMRLFDKEQSKQCQRLYSKQAFPFLRNSTILNRKFGPVVNIML